MKFGIFFELSVPRPFSTAIERQVYENALEQCRVADELGFHWAWAVEHHFLEEYSHCSAPELFLTAVAMQTKRIRVGHGAVVCVPEMNHPIRVAERAAVLDLLSNGRLELGTARSSTWTELGGFQVNPDDTKKTWDEFVRALPVLWKREPVRWNGRCFSMPERNILPKCVQDPHPPLWVTVTSPGTELDAAERGIGCLGVSAASYQEQERRTREFHRRIQQCNPVSSVVNDQVATLNFLYCHEDRKRAADVGMRFLGTFSVANSHLLWTREAFPTRAYQSLANLAPSSQSQATNPSEGALLPEGLCIGDPEHCTLAIKRWESMGVTGVNFLLNGMEVVPQQAVLDSLRLFAKEVMPQFTKREALAPARAAEMRA
jgi:alkanesulfonate monooxygenase SsuD/methylene tetrahydromethanopterin reductase-like flavin-dependent oxidoreductase (luciferase family)